MRTTSATTATDLFLWQLWHFLHISLKKLKSVLPLNIEYVLTAGKEEQCSQPKKAIIQKILTIVECKSANTCYSILNYN